MLLYILFHIYSGRIIAWKCYDPLYVSKKSKLHKLVESAEIIDLSPSSNESGQLFSCFCPLQHIYSFACEAGAQEAPVK